MKELNISRCIIKKRKEKGITQEQLAEYVGVSKASVSKWESGQSYPDILLLPELATYFNISVDDLLGYSPQLTKEDIKKVYNNIVQEFASKPFDDVIKHCNSIIREYYSCFPLLLSMIQLLINYSSLAKSEETKKGILQQCISLCKRVKEESGDMAYIKNANTMEAVSEMALGNMERVISLLSDKLIPYGGDDVMLISAYKMQGQLERADKINQILLYQNVISITMLLTNYLSMHMTEPMLFEQIYIQGQQITDIFQTKDFSIHLAAAQGYLLQQDKEKALNALERYAEIVCGYKYPLKLEPNGYFNKVGEWLEENLPIGTSSPVDELTIKSGFVKMIEENPVFKVLKDEDKYKKIIRKLNSLTA